MKLTNTRLLGRYKKKPDSTPVNVYKGRRAERGTDVYYYLFRQSRVLISDTEFHSEWVKV